jgi:hypothetical protein
VKILIYGRNSKDLASGGQGRFLKKLPLDPAKIFIGPLHANSRFHIGRIVS